MSKVFRVILVSAILVISSSANLFAIDRVAARFNVMELTVSSAQAHGSYGSIGLGVQEYNFSPFELDADNVYENSNSFGINYGRLLNDNQLFSVGFSFIDVKHKERFSTGNVVFIDSYPDFYKLRMYNIDFNLNYYFMSPVKETFAPYAGVGLQTGLLSVSVTDFASESDFIIATAFNFGADFTIWKAKNKMNSLAISSVNSYQFYASESRPKYLTIGFGLKYFMRP